MINISKVLTVGMVRDFLQDLDEDVKVITNSGNFEMLHHLVSATLRITKCAEKEETFKDTINNTIHTVKTFNRSDLGETVVIIAG